MSWFRRKSAAMRMAAAMDKAGIDFIPIPIMNEKDFEILKEEHNHRLDVIKDYWKKESESIGRLNA